MQIGKPLFSDLLGIKIWLIKLYESVLSKIDLRDDTGTITNDYKSQNLDAKWYIVSDTGTINTEFSITHSLYRIPVGAIVVSQSIAGSLYDSDRSNWTSTVVKFKFSAANGAIRLLIF